MNEQPLFSLRNPWFGASVGVNGLAVAGCRLAGNTSGPFDTSVASDVQLAANVVGAFPAV